MRGADGFFLFIAKKFPLGGSGNDGKGRVLMKKQWGQIGGKFSKMSREPPKKHEKTGFKPVLLEQETGVEPAGISLGS